MAHPGIEVVVLDGATRFPEGRRYTIARDGELSVLTEDGQVVARFAVGVWLSATDLSTLP